MLRNKVAKFLLVLGILAKSVTIANAITTADENKIVQDNGGTELNTKAYNAGYINGDLIYIKLPAKVGYDKSNILVKAYNDKIEPIACYSEVVQTADQKDENTDANVKVGNFISIKLGEDTALMGKRYLVLDMSKLYPTEGNIVDFDRNYDKFCIVEVEKTGKPSDIIPTYDLSINMSLKIKKLELPSDAKVVTTPKASIYESSTTAKENISYKIDPTFQANVKESAWYILLAIFSLSFIGHQLINRGGK